MIIEMEMWQFLAVIVLIVVAAVISAWDDVRKNRIIRAQAEIIKIQRRQIGLTRLYEDTLKEVEDADGAAR